MQPSCTGRRSEIPSFPGSSGPISSKEKTSSSSVVEQGKTERLRLEFGVGSGKHGVTFVTTVPGAGPSAGPTGIEHRFSYVTSAAKMEITPGQEAEDAKRLKVASVHFGRNIAADKLRACLDCHVTLTSRVRSDHLDPATLVPNVGCERCHGPGRDHIAAVNSQQEDLKMPMALLTEPTYQVESCGECHRLPSKFSKSSLNPLNPELVRFQSVGISLSPCFQDGQSGLKCTSCHDAHGRTSRDRVAYEAVCLECHQANGPLKACPVSPREQCVRCHMPRKDVPGGFVFTDHWIRKPDKPAREKFDSGGPSPPGSVPTGMH